MPDSTTGTLLCITPAPAIDRTAHVERLELGTVLRPTELAALPGGKGVNAARAATSLGGSVLTTGIAGGHAGRWIVERLEAEGLRPRWARASAESRTTYVTVDRDGRSVIVYEQPGRATEIEFEHFLSLLRHDLLPVCSRAIVAGSVPSGLRVSAHGAIVALCREVDRPLLVDASSGGLLAALAAGPDLVKVGRVEVAEARVVTETSSAVDAALALVDHGARVAVVTDGPAEVAAADASTVWRMAVPQVEALNAVGSGDAFNAGLSLALMDGADLQTALVRGAAAGSANAMTLTAGLLDPAVARTLEAEVSITAVGRS